MLKVVYDKKGWYMRKKYVNVMLKPYVIKVVEIIKNIMLMLC
jgi:hypothetical protein